MRDNAKLIKKMNEACSCHAEKYCLLKEIIVCSHDSPRFLVQLKCVEKFKYEESQRRGKDIGWDEAHLEWVSLGYAKKFADLYDEDLTAVELYKKIKELK